MMAEQTRTVDCECCVLGAGPAGLSAALELARRGLRNVVVVDRLPVVGGLSRTEARDGCRFDVGPHRFFTTNQDILTLWRETLGKDFLPVNRLTRIVYNGSFFHYPIRAGEALTRLGPGRAARALASYLRARLAPAKEAVTFEDWIVDRFGRVLFETFFKTYTEKVWGIPCNRIGAEWAAQRIKGLDLAGVLKKALRPGSGSRAKTLVEQFDYPRMGAGQMYEALAERAADLGVRFELGAEVTGVHVQEDRVSSIEVSGRDGSHTRIGADHFLSSIPLTHFFALADQPWESEVHQAARVLSYRDHVSVNLVVDRPQVFPDQWVYVHASEVGCARIANYGNFSPAMTGNRPLTALGVEYFTFHSEPLFAMQDDDLVDLATQELASLGLVEPRSVASGWVGRETECYPSYAMGYRPHFDRLRQAVDRLANLTPMGRAGLYRYNNMDHSMLTGLAAARNYLDRSGAARDIWNINAEAKYLESGRR